MKLSVYGSTGFIGSNFVKLYPNHEIIKREDRKPLSDDILYFISTVDNYNLYKDTCIDVKTNLSVLCEVLNFCKKEDIVFNFISSWFVYGKSGSLPANESSICNPKGFYSITKKCAEDLLVSFSETFKIKYRIIRLSNVLGKGDRNISNKKNALTWMVNKLKTNETIELYDNGEPIRDIIHVKDACNAIDLICKKGKTNEIYNVGSGKPITIGKFVDIAKARIRSKSRIISIDAPEFHSKVQSKDFWMDNQKLQSLGFKLNFSHEDIINELCL
tara:strand:+ start:653 stop:1471 length:819 start_codon:yes stop_codon:yes gene_type:complete